LWFFSVELRLQIYSLLTLTTVFTRLMQETTRKSLRRWLLQTPCPEKRDILVVPSVAKITDETLMSNNTSTSKVRLIISNIITYQSWHFY
jgi:predicted ATP-dependent serine protease